jgi:hypothetical protein
MMLFYYVECHILFTFMLNVVMVSVVILSVVMLSVVILNLVMLSVVKLNVFMLRVVKLNVVMLSVIMLYVTAPIAASKSLKHRFQNSCDFGCSNDCNYSLGFDSSLFK